jgi:hypothetical protein
MPEPQWLVDKMVIDRALGFIYGPPGCLKTFIALDMALSLTTGQADWWGRKIQHPGAVVYISSEGLGDLKFRILAWEQNRKTNADFSPFYLIRDNINFMRGDDVGRLLATIDTIAARAGQPIAAVFVDTVSRVLPGAEENLQRDMTLFIAACDNIRQQFGATVIGIHHTSRAGNMRGSTVMPGAADFIIEVRRETGAMSGSIFAAKIKGDEDGWEQFFKVQKIDLPTIVPHTSLVIDAVDVAPKAAHGDGLPDIQVCREILSEMDESWKRGAPWSHAANSQRPAVRFIMVKWRLKRDAVKRLLDNWTMNKVIEHAERDIKRRVSGYRKVVDI